MVVAGGCDYYPGLADRLARASRFAVTRLRVAGEGDLLAQLEQLRRKLHAEGLFAPQKALPRPQLPRCIGVVTGRVGQGARRRPGGPAPPRLGRDGSCGASRPCRTATRRPRSRRALQDLAACEEVEVIVVARGGGSLADLFAFCDETLCRTVALLRVPVISSVGHHTDRTLLDDVAAVACSTPTHAAETAVPVDCAAARARARGQRRAGWSARAAARCSSAPARSPASRARPAHHVARHRTRLHQHLRELRAATRRAVAAGERHDAGRAPRRSRASATAAAAAGDRAARRARADATALDRTAAAALERRRRDLDRILATLAAHDPQRTLERGYALRRGRRRASRSRAPRPPARSRR